MNYCIVALTLVISPSVLLSQSTHEVGPGHTYANIEDAYAAATAGDTVLVFPQIGNAPYLQPAILVQKSNLTFKGVPTSNGERVKLDGNGFDYSGAGSVPRAIFQFSPGSDNGIVSGFNIYGASNASGNGAGVRINQANRVSIIDCEIHLNDMGIMSNGNGLLTTATEQLIESCLIHDNGNLAHAGYNHNLYLGGSSAIVRFCEIAESTTGHNLKSRAHQTWVMYCYIHDSANRELDLVDATETDQAESHAVLIGNIIVKNPATTGNKAVIHFGQDGGHDHNGTIFLVNNSIVTPFISAVLDLSAPSATATLINNFTTDNGAGTSNQTIATARNGATLLNIIGVGNWFDQGFTDAGGTALAPNLNRFGHNLSPAFNNASIGDYRPGVSFPKGLPVWLMPLPLFPAILGAELPLAWFYFPVASSHARPNVSRPTIGAYH